jgi:hypothetical protein
MRNFSDLLLRFSRREHFRHPLMWVIPRDPPVLELEDETQASASILRSCLVAGVTMATK